MTAQFRNRWFLDPGPVSSWIDQFADELGTQRYSPLTIEGCKASARHFAVWLESTGIPIVSVNGGVVRCFAEHQCQCPGGLRSA